MQINRISFQTILGSQIQTVGMNSPLLDTVSSDIIKIHDVFLTFSKRMSLTDAQFGMNMSPELKSNVTAPLGWNCNEFEVTTG